MEKALQEFNAQIEEINKLIEEFKKYFKDNILNGISLSNCMDVNNSFKNETWPNKDQAGVYILFGYLNEKNNKQIYVGKASMNQKIGDRLYAHLHNHKNNNDEYKMGNFTIKYLATIPIEQLSNNTKYTTFLAPALEEFLIKNLSENDKINLINSVGL